MIRRKIHADYSTFRKSEDRMLVWSKHGKIKQLHQLEGTYIMGILRPGRSKKRENFNYSYDQSPKGLNRQHQGNRQISDGERGRFNCRSIPDSWCDF